MVKTAFFLPKNGSLLLDRFEAMSVLLAAVRAGSLSAAARELGQPLATVSRKVSALEKHLNTQLLVRTSRKLEMTVAGRSYVAACEQILSDVQEAELAASGEYSTPKGDLVLTAPVVFGRLHLLPVVMEFLRAHPKIDVQLRLHDRVVHLLDEQIDVALRIGHLPDSNLIGVPVGHVRMVTCASPAYLKKHGPPETPEQLTAHTLINFDNIGGFRNWAFENEKQLRLPKSRLVVTTAEAAIDAAAGGLGITRVLSYQIAEYQKQGQLEEILTDYQPEPYPVSLVYAKQGLLPLKVRAFLDFARPRLRETVEAIELVH
jgi:DNA-binding transcriptional LysR family regulator